MVHTIDRVSLQQKMASPVPPLILEALPARYYADRHLPGALHFPHDAAEQGAVRLLPERDAEIVVYCANVQCGNSHLAAQRLDAMGYTRVSVYAGGKQDWDAAGLPFEASIPATA